MPKNKKNIIYVVFGSTGEYSDRTEWMVRAFADETKAQELVTLATAEAQNYAAKRKNVYGADPKAVANRYDPEMEMDYTGTFYSYASVELVS